ncbi:BTAD domain-containing putative transcriptional regulator [Microcoleus sp. herbarium7]|uniref:BTAD domain-containing putative transcriptional regulator n=1 Tax=Microcoleus sp. herbarium7 TaxID=3055435 RepID=UPI002FD5207E
MPSTLQIQLLGGFCLSYADRAVGGVAAERLQSLLAYLVLHRQIPQTRQRLAFEFWPDSTEAQARTNLRRELHHLRQGLPDADRFLLTDAKTLQWNPHEPFVLDVAEFQRALATAETAERSADVKSARTAWEQAIALYGGDLLPSCEDEWIVPEREHLRQKLLRALESLTCLSEAEGDYRGAIRFAQRLLEIQPLHESSYAALMRSHHLNGDRANALQVYHRCMTVLREELGVDPSASTRKLYEQMLLEDEATDIQPSSHPEPRPQIALFPSSLAAPPLVGREGEWASIQQWANPILFGNPAANGTVEPSPVLLLLGEPGIGKTRLLEELRSTAPGLQVLWGRGFAAEMVRPYGIWIDALRSLPMPAKIPPELGVLLPEIGRSPESGLDRPPANLPDRSYLFDAVVQLLAQFADRTPVIVILDDIQWIDEASSALLHYAIRLLSHLRVGFACTGRSGEIEENGGAGRVVQALRRDRRLLTLELHPFDRAQTAELIRKQQAVNGLELSIELVDRVFIDSGGNPLFALEVARALSQDRSARADNLEALIRDRLHQLDDAAIEFLPWAAALGRSFQPTAVAHVADYPLPKLLMAIEQLEQQTIIRPSTSLGEEMGYDFAHDIVRQAVYRQLSQPRRHLIHLQIARKLSQLSSPDNALAGDIAHHAAIGGDRELAASSALLAAERYLKLFGYAEASELAQFGIQHCQRLDDRTRIQLHLGLLRVCALAGVTGDRVSQLDSDVHRLIDEANALGVEAAEATGFEALVILHFDRSNFASVHQHSLQAAEASRAASPATAVRLMAYSGSCLAEIGREMARAEALLLEAQSLAARVGLKEIGIAQGLGAVQRHHGNYAEARVLWQQAWRWAVSQQDRWCECHNLSYLAMAELEAGDPAAALPYCQEMAIVSGKIKGEGSEGAIAQALLALANYQLRQPGADVCLERAIATLQQIDAKRMLSYVLIRAAQIDLDCDRTFLATTRAEAALAAAQTVDHPSEIALAWAILIRGILGLGDRERAIELFEGYKDRIDRPALSFRARKEVDRAIELI